MPHVKTPYAKGEHPLRTLGRGRRKKNAVMEEGRRCKLCGLPLSIYNKGKQCRPHDVPKDQKPSPETKCSIMAAEEAARWD